MTAIQEETREHQPLPAEVAAWLQNYPEQIAPEIPAWHSSTRPSLLDKFFNFLKLGWTVVVGINDLPNHYLQFLELKQADKYLTPTVPTERWLKTDDQGELLQLAEVIHAAEHLEPAEFKKKWLNEQAQKQGYYSFNLPSAFVDRVRDVVTTLPSHLLAEIEVGRALSTEIRVVVDPERAREIFQDKTVTKGQLHAAVNTLGGTAFNSAGESHKSLRKDIAAYGTPAATARALTEQGPKLTANVLEAMAGLSQTTQKVDAVTLVHRFTLALFAETYFPQLKMEDEQAKQVRSKPEQVFGAGAAARLTDGAVHWLVEAYYNRETNSLNYVFVEAFLAYADELAKKEAFASSARDLAFIDRVVLMAYQAQSYELLFNNLMSAVAAGTDTVTQVSVEALIGVLQPGSKQRALIVDEFFELHDKQHAGLVNKLRHRNFNLTEEEWRVIVRYCQGYTRTSDQNETELRSYVKRVADASAPVALTFKARPEQKKVAGSEPGEEVVIEEEVTYLMPLKLLAHDSDITAFGVEGSQSICTGQSQATTTIAFLTLMASLSEYTMEVPSPLPKKKTGVVSTYAELLVGFKTANGNHNKNT